MSWDGQSGFVVKEKEELKELLQSKDLSFLDISLDTKIVVTSKALDSYLEPGSLIVIDEELKNGFIEKHIYTFLGSKENAEKLLGKFNTKKEMFDKFWYLEPAYCINIPINIEYEE